MQVSFRASLEYSERGILLKVHLVPWWVPPGLGYRMPFVVDRRQVVDLVRSG